MTSTLVYILLVLFLTHSGALNTVLNVDEITSIHYAVDILNKPVMKDQVFEGEVITVVNKHGQEYVCSLPSVPSYDGDSKTEENILDQLVDISGLLKPMETAPCLIKTVDWWTYEFCYGSVIKQYHLEDNKASGPILILGKYESEYNWKNSSETKNRLQRFHSQFYVNGTKCDLTGEPRRTEVRFHCEDGVGDYIQRVDEPESCRYVVTVATTRVCHHPYLRLQTVRTPHAITCAPALSKEQYHRYLAFQEKKAKEEESLKEKWLKQNAEVLGDSDSDQSLEARSDDDDDEELKMSIKIFRLSPFKKQKTAQTAETKAEGMEMETQITLEENDLQLKVEDINLSTEEGGLEKPSSSSEFAEAKTERTRGDIPAEEEEDGGVLNEVGEDRGLLPGLKTDELLRLLEVDESDLEEEDELENDENDDEDLDDDDEDGEDENNDIEEEENDEKTLRQASKSTSRDHFSKLQRRLKQLGNMFMNQENEEVPGGGDNGMLQHMMDSIKDGHIKQLEQEVKEWTKKLLNKDLLLDMDEEDMEEEEQRLGLALSSLMDALDKAENKLSIAKKEMETLEEFLDNQLKEMEHSSSEDKEDSSDGESSTRDSLNSDSQDPMEGMSQTPDNLQSDVEEVTKKTSKKGSADEFSEPTQEVHIIKNKAEDETQKAKLEQTIKDRLQKLGLEKIGRKFEVKILTPNSVDDEDPDNHLLSQEETEAFQNMIVNLLSANAEELEERENHRKLEKNYDFKWEDTQASDEDE